MTGKKYVNIEQIELVGNYAIRIVFDDGHDTGIYAWEYLRELGEKRESFWQRYLEELKVANASRLPSIPLGHWQPDKGRRNDDIATTSQWILASRPFPPKKRHAASATCFAPVAQRYDVMNDLMSFGSHRIMKRITIEMSGVRAGHNVLDLAGGTGDLTRPLFAARRTGGTSDPRGHQRRDDRRRSRPFARSGHDERDLLPSRRRSIAIRRRRVQLRDDRLWPAQRNAQGTRIGARCIACCGPAGVCWCSNFPSRRIRIVAAAYGAFQSPWPAIGQAVTGDANAYRYLVESIEMHPTQKALKLMIADAGFANVAYAQHPQRNRCNPSRRQSAVSPFFSVLTKWAEDARQRCCRSRSADPRAARQTQRPQRRDRHEAVG